MLNKVLGKYAIDFQETADGEAYRINCPFCGNRKFKVYIYIKSKLTVCYRCGERGGIWKFLKAHGVKDRIQIRERITSRPKFKPSPPPSLPLEFKIINPASTSMLALRAKAFLNKRGLSDLDIESYQMGYCLEGPHAGNIIIPIFDDSKTLTSWQGRRFWLPGPKSTNPTHANTQAQLFCMDRAIGKKYLILVEGPFDAIVLNKMFEGTEFAAVALLGHHISKLQASIIRDILKPEIVWVMLDPDAVQDQRNICFTLRKYGIIEIRTCRLVDKDPDELTEDELADQICGAKSFR